MCQYTTVRYACGHDSTQRQSSCTVENAYPGRCRERSVQGMRTERQRDCTACELSPAPAPRREDALRRSVSDARAIERCGRTATLLEWDDRIPSFDEVHREALKANKYLPAPSATARAA